MVVYINPLNQRIIWKDVRMGFEKTSCMDRLDDDLNFKKTEKRITGSPEELLEIVSRETKFKRRQWVKLDVEGGFRMTEVWKRAMDKYKSKIL